MAVIQLADERRLKSTLHFLAAYMTHQYRHSTLIQNTSVLCYIKRKLIHIYLSLVNIPLIFHA